MLPYRPPPPLCVKQLLSVTGVDERLPGRAGGYPPGPPTDPYVRDSRIRFLKQSGGCPLAVHWPAVVRVGALNVSPLSPASGCAARRRFPSRGSLGPHFPTFPGTLRRYDCHYVPLGSLRVSLASRYLACFHGSCIPYGLVTWSKRPVHARAFGHPVPHSGHVVKETGGSPTFPSYPSRHMPRSQTPVVSCALAIAHPGLLPSGQWKPSAFLSVLPGEISLCPRLYPFRGSITRPASSLHPAPYGPLRGGTRVHY